MPVLGPLLTICFSPFIRNRIRGIKRKENAQPQYIWHNGRASTGRQRKRMQFDTDGTT